MRIGHPLFKWAVILAAVAFGLWGLADLVGTSDQRESETFDPRSAGSPSPEHSVSPPATPEVLPEIPDSPPSPTPSATAADSTARISRPAGRRRFGTKAGGRRFATGIETVRVVKEGDESVASEEDFESAGEDAGDFDVEDNGGDGDGQEADDDDPSGNEGDQDSTGDEDGMTNDPSESTGEEAGAFGGDEGGAAGAKGSNSTVDASEP